ncbi:unnamed protein product [Somion occarium]|uniref:Uncharacterized protein n=1 Tax=Somion occarium TaxID=3059160 RepID=A0ABP1E974_9APHY
MLFFNLLLMGFVTLIGVMDVFFDLSLVVYSKAAFDLVFDIPIIAYFVVQGSPSFTEPLDAALQSPFDVCSWGIPGLLSLRPITLPPSTINTSRELQVYDSAQFALTMTAPTECLSANPQDGQVGDAPLHLSSDFGPVTSERRRARANSGFYSRGGMSYVIAAVLLQSVVLSLMVRAILGPSVYVQETTCTAQHVALDPEHLDSSGTVTDTPQNIPSSVSPRLTAIAPNLSTMHSPPTPPFVQAQHAAEAGAGVSSMDVEPKKKKKLTRRGGQWRRIQRAEGHRKIREAAEAAVANATNNQTPIPRSETPSDPLNLWLNPDI